MLADLKLKSFRDLVKDATRDELVWMNGFITAFLEVNGAAPQAATGHDANSKAASALAGCTVVYGTESGNSKKVAVDLNNRLKKHGVQAKIKSLDQYKTTDLAKESCLLVVMSTQGDGEPPAAAKKFYDHLMQNDLALGGLKYGVLALGDTSYPLFCQAGEDIDVRLTKLGAERIIPLKKCDTDFEEDARLWIDELLLSATAPANGVATAAVSAKPAKAGKKTYEGVVSTSINLNDRGSAKETYHVEITSEDEIVYEPGDSIGIIAHNNPATVARVLELLGAAGDEALVYKETPYTAATLFTEKINIQYLPERIIQQYAKLVGKEIPGTRMDLADLLRIYPADNGVSLQQLVNIQEAIVPRLYSISSSPAAHGPNEVHITVSRSKFLVDGHTRYGLCSDYLSILEVGQKLAFYVQKNSAFKLPDAGTDTIMIGPGTGIAPFRSFLFERDSQGASGRNWLFFGDQHFVSDFLYQTELQSLMETGVLTRLNTAFSRDQAQKLYVQHRMQQQGVELFNWIENGANVYICGAKDPMSSDVEEALINIIATGKDINKADAKNYLQQLKEAGRYHKDVY